MANIEVKAPGVVKLLGEHAVVYGRLAVAAAISIYAKSAVKQTGGRGLTILLPDVTSSHVSLDKNDLKALFSSFKARKSMHAYFEDNKGIGEAVLPYATIAARLFAEHKLNPEGIEVSITSAIPLQKGFASSAACSTAFTVSLLNASKIALPDSSVIDIARDGDRIIHMNEGAGAIDISTSYYGGYVSYSASSGARKEDIGTKLELLLVDTGPKKSTAEMVNKVTESYKKDKMHIEKILDQIDECSKAGINALKSGDIVRLGSLMLMDHALLSELGVSSDSLDAFIDFARKNKFYGAKLSGGGGGGAAIGICADVATMEAAAMESGFDARSIPVSLEGAKSFYLYKSE